MRCCNVNIQYLPCNKSVYFPSTKREAGDSCKAGDLIAWTNTCLLRLARGQGRCLIYIIFEAQGIIGDKIEKGSSNKSRLLYIFLSRRGNMAIFAKVAASAARIFYGTLLLYRNGFFSRFCSLLRILVTELWMAWEIINSRSKWFNQECFQQIFWGYKKSFSVTLYLLFFIDRNKKCPPFLALAA